MIQIKAVAAHVDYLYPKTLSRESSMRLGNKTLSFTLHEQLRYALLGVFIASYLVYRLPI